MNTKHHKNYIYIKYILILIFNLLLTGCSNHNTFLTTCIATTFSAKIAFDPRSIGTYIDDSIINSRINNIIYKNNIFIKNKSRIKNIVYQGKVLLIGQTKTKKLSKYAEKLTMYINGVTDVHNAIRIQNSISIFYILQDQWINFQIYSKLLLYYPKILYQIKFLTENKEVFILGIIYNKSDTKIIENILNSIDDIKQINTGYIYI